MQQCNIYKKDITYIIQFLQIYNHKMTHLNAGAPIHVQTVDTVKPSAVNWLIGTLLVSCHFCDEGVFE